MTGRPMTRTETKEKRKRTTTTKQNTSNNSNLVEEVTPQILFLDTKPFVSDAYFKWVRIFKNKLVKSFFSFVQE